MRDQEIYVTCVCGALVNENSMSQHVEDCLKEDFIKNAVSLKINHASRVEVTPKERHVCAKCVRCGHPMRKDEGTLITFYPSVYESSSIKCCHYGKSRMMNAMKESVCKMCNLPNQFHQSAPHEEKVVNDCLENIGIEKESPDSNGKQSDKAGKCREQPATVSQFLENVSESENVDSDDEPEHEHLVVHEEIPNGHPCKLFHVALLPNYNNTDCQEELKYRNYSLLLQILDNLPSCTSVETQADLPTTTDVGVQANILGVYPKEVEELIAAEQRYSVPEYDPAVEAAFRSHLSTLIPCSHCSRTFSPDRIQRHISCCIERPKTRKCVTPTDGEIKR